MFSILVPTLTQKLNHASNRTVCNSRAVEHARLGPEHFARSSLRPRYRRHYRRWALAKRRAGDRLLPTLRRSRLWTRSKCASLLLRNRDWGCEQPGPGGRLVSQSCATRGPAGGLASWTALLPGQWRGARSRCSAEITQAVGRPEQRFWRLLPWASDGGSRLCQGSEAV